MSQDELASNSEEIKPIALSIFKLCLAGGIGSASQVVENSTKKLKFIETC